MDWLNGLNKVMGYIEENLTDRIRYESLASMAGCSVYEFSRVFSSYNKFIANQNRL